MTLDVRDAAYVRWNDDGTIYDCADDGYLCDLVTVDGITVCTQCGDRPHVRNASGEVTTNA